MLDSLESTFHTKSDIIARVVLHGHLRKKFGPEYTIAASTSARAVAVLCIMKPGFRAALMEGEYRVVRGAMKNGVDLDERMLHLRLPPSGEMHIWPVAKGRKKGGVGKVIVGAVLVIAAVILAFPTGGASLGFATPVLFGITAGSVAMFGGAMILGGITQMLSPQPAGSTSAATKEAPDAAQSFLLGGQLNVAQQGIPIPVPYGRIMTGSVVVSVGYEAAEYVPGTAPTQGGEQQPAGQSGSAGDPGANFTQYGTGTVAFSNDPHTEGPGGSEGGGGGAKGDSPSAPQQHTPVEAPNTLRSKATVRIIDVIGEGPIGGLPLDAQSIFFNGTPLQAADGTFNFNGVGWSERFGYPDQDPVPGFPASEETVAVNTQVRFSTGPVTQQVQSATANGLRLTVRVPALYSADTTNGDVNGSEVKFKVEIRPSRTGAGGFVAGWITMLDTSIVGKCQSPYERSYRMELPFLTELGANTWDVKLTRITPDSDRVSLANDLIFGLMTLITDHQLMYPDTAYVALTFDAELFGTNIPARTYLIDGRLVWVPQNYDPVQRVYSPSGLGTTGGTWDTISFKQAVTSNPAWVLYDMLTDTRYGCGIPGQSTETTRADLYVISQYCDGLVPGGFGALEPRYAVNAIITEQAEAYVMLQTMVSAFRGMTHWGAGQVVVTADMPKNPLKLVNQTNVIDGDFDYQGTSLKTRHNVVRVTWRDPQKQYVPTTETVEMTADIARRGVIAADLTAWGCTSRGLAHRLGKWFLFTENNQTEMVQYDASLYHLDMRPGDIFQQEDPLYFGLRYGGRLRQESTQTVLHLDSLVQLLPASTYTLSVVMPDNTVFGANNNVGFQQFTTSADGSYTIIVLLAPLPQQPMPNAEWILVDANTVPRLFQTVSVAQPQPGRYQVTAAQYNPGKFDYVEFGIAFPEQVFSHLPELVAAALSPPSDVTAIDYMVGVGATQILRVTVNWNPPNDIRVDHFQVLANGDGFAQLFDADGAGKDIDGLVPGIYSFSVRSMSAHGATSVWVSTPNVVVDGKVDAPPAPTGLTVIGGTRRLMLNWIQVARRDIREYEIQRAPYLNGFPTSYATIARIGGSSYIDGQSDLLFPHTRWFYRVRAITFTDIAGEWSLDAWGETTLLIVDDLADGIINTAKFAHGLAVPTLSDTVPTAPPQTGDSGMVFVTTTGQLYTWNGTIWHSIADQVAAATTLVPAGNITGQLTSSQIADLAAAKITGQITGTQILDGSISTPELAAGAVTTAKIAAGAVTTEMLSVGSASNVIWNSCLEQSSDGWNFSSTVGFLNGTEFGTVKNTAYDPTFRLAGFGTGYMHAAAGLATNGTQVMLATWDPNYLDAGNPLGVPFPPSTPIEGQALVMTNRCAAYARIDFYTDQGAFISFIGGTRITFALPADGRSQGQYRQTWVHGTSPGNCARARFSVVAFNDGAADILPQVETPHLFWTKVAIGASVANATQAQPWAPGGMTTITGSMIKTQTIVAAQIAAGAIGATQIAAGAIVAGKIAVNAVIAGTIQAAAVGASEIAAGQIRSTHLATDFVLANAAQIGTAVIGTAQIQDLAVGNLKIGPSAVTNIAFASSAGQQLTTLNFFTDGSPVMVLLAVEPGVSAAGNRGSGTFYRDGAPKVVTLLDFPPAGSHTYQYGFGASSIDGIPWGPSHAATAFAQILAITIKK